MTPAQGPGYLSGVGATEPQPSGAAQAQIKGHQAFAHSARPENQSHYA